MQRPLVTIGMPTFNAATTVHRALDSIIDQSYDYWRLYISDDFSTDSTRDIISEYSDKSNGKIIAYPPSEKQYYMNFRRLLNAADTPYFVWLAGDDWWEPTFLEECVNKLEAEPDSVCCLGRCIFFNPDGTTYMDPGCQPLLGSVAERMLAYLEAPDQTRMYGVFRREVLAVSFPPAPFHAYDWALCLRTLRHGIHHSIDKHLMNREKTPSHSYIEAVNRDEPTLIYQLFPILRMTRWLVREEVAVRDTLVLAALFRLNVLKHMEQVHSRTPRLFRVLRPFYGIAKRSADLIQRWTVARRLQARSE